MSSECTEEVVNFLAQKYIDSMKLGPKGQKELGCPPYAYYMSKILINAWIRQYAQTDDVLSRGIQVYGLCPGMTKTDMFAKGLRTIQQGAECPVYLINTEYQIN
jgi:NAD(P)-dependent dehydrogenase (short-subunit alcohol dehydrogenase family)